MSAQEGLVCSRCSVAAVVQRGVPRECAASEGAAVAVLALLLGRLGAHVAHPPGGARREGAEVARVPSEQRPQPTFFPAGPRAISNGW